jgi:hypothetical protein
VVLAAAPPKAGVAQVARCAGGEKGLAARGREGLVAKANTPRGAWPARASSGGLTWSVSISCTVIGKRQARRPALIRSILAPPSSFVLYAGSRSAAGCRQQSARGKGRRGILPQRNCICGKGGAHSAAAGMAPMAGPGRNGATRRAGRASLGADPRHLPRTAQASDETAASTVASRLAPTSAAGAA